MTRHIQTTATATNSDAGTPMRLLDGLPHESEWALARWLEALSELPVDAWLVAGEPRFTLTNPARDRMESVLHEQHLELTAWFIRDLVATSSHRAASAARRLPRAAQRRFSAARSAADWTALAIATQSWLSDAECDALCAPFDSVIPRRPRPLVQAS
jgi:hypothetical protein